MNAPFPSATTAAGHRPGPDTLWGVLGIVLGLLCCGILGLVFGCCRSGTRVATADRRCSAGWRSLWVSST